MERNGLYVVRRTFVTQDHHVIPAGALVHASVRDVAAWEALGLLTPHKGTVEAEPKTEHSLEAKS